MKIFKYLYKNFLRRDTLTNPVFIIGSGRSGTTFFKELLRKHPDIFMYPGEANDLWHPALYPYHESEIDVPPIWLDPVTFTNTSIANWPVGWGEHIKKEFKNKWLPYKRKVFFHKTVMINFMVPKILELFPNAKFIFMVRNGWSVALSYQKKRR